MHVKGNQIYSRHRTFENQNGFNVMSTSPAHPSDWKYQSNWVNQKRKPQPKQGFPDLPTVGWFHLKNCFTACGELNQNPCEKHLYICFIQKAYVNSQYFIHCCPCSHHWKITFRVLCFFVDVSNPRKGPWTWWPIIRVKMPSLLPLQRHLLKLFESPSTQKTAPWGTLNMSFPAWAKICF